MDEHEIKSRALDVCRNGVLITDPTLPDNPIIYANTSFENMTGYSKHEIIGKNCRFLQGSDRQQPIIDKLRQAVVSGKEFYGILRNYRKNGDLFWNELSITPVFDAQGELTNFIGIQQEVTERIMLQKALEQERENAEQASLQKSQFLTYVSHDFKTPLGAILGYAAMVLNGDTNNLSEKQKRYLHHIKGSAEHLLSMVNDLLDVASLSAGKLKLVIDNIDLYPFIMNIMEMMSQSAEQKHVQLELEIQPGLYEIFADASRLRQVFLNLLSNAIKYNRKGGRVIIRINASSDKQWIIVQVEDTGMGIPEEILPHLFVDYFRASQSLKANIEGTGLGLVLTKYLVELHGGQIQVESKEGVGSKFTFKLPLREKKREYP